MRALRILAVAVLLLAASAIAPPRASAAACALSAGNLGIAVGDGQAVVLVNDGRSIDVQGVVGCATAIASITAGISVSGTGGDNTVEVRLHPTVAYPTILLALLGGEDSVLVVGTAGNDVLTVASKFSSGTAIERFSIDGAAGDDTISASGWSGPITLLGGSGDDTLVGTGSSDAIDGGPGDDTLAGRGGADAIEGGTGADDAADYSASPSAVAVSVNAGATANVGGDATGDRLSGVEDLIGSAFGDILTGDPGPNGLLGNAGDDLLAGRGGADLLAGGAGIDTASYAGSPSAVQVSLALGGAGGDAAGDQLAGVENLAGSSFADRLTGDGFANRLSGGSGSDVLLGGAGNDTFLGGPGNDFIDGGIGIDVVAFPGVRRAVRIDLPSGRATGDGIDTLRSLEGATGGPRDDAIIGTNRANVLSGGGGADSIAGGAGDDRLLGGGGADRLFGGAGADAIDGGSGKDLCDGGSETDTYKACDGTGAP